MTPVLLSQLCDVVSGELVGDDHPIDNYSTDTRTVATGDVYFCLRGDNFDGHDFVGQAVENGAIAVVCEKELNLATTQLIVKDTREALGRFAMLWRQQFEKPVVGVTGSNGKTTVKQLLASIFNQAGSVHYTVANNNNDIGVPQTLLGLDDSHDFAVVEMGASGIGEIKWLGELVKPTVSVITNAGAAHLEGFGDAQSVAQEKAWIYRSLSADGTAVINADDKFFDYWLELCSDRRVLSFGAAGDVSASRHADGSITVSYQGKTVNCEYPLVGEHNVLNAAAAAACALAAGVSLESIAKGLAAAEPVAGRLNFVELASGVTVIDDTYNANPASTRAAIDVLRERKGQRILVLGDLLELGPDEVAQHRSIGEYAKSNNVDRLLAFGDLSKHAVMAYGDGAISFATQEQLIDMLHAELGNNTTVLVKGSRSMKMERVVTAITAARSATGAAERAEPEAGVCCQ